MYADSIKPKFRVVISSEEEERHQNYTYDLRKLPLYQDVLQMFDGYIKCNYVIINSLRYFLN